jgi:hypothetical protein
MSDEDYIRSGAEAERRFEQLHRRATIESALRKLAGHLPHLLPFKDVQKRLGLRHAREIGARDIRLDKIVGSVGKPDAFTPSFLPRYARLKERWKRVYAVAHGWIGLPPIEVYQVGEVYFINDGHHRVSVARHLGAKTITAYVTQFVAARQPPVDRDIEDLIADERVI